MVSLSYFREDRQNIYDLGADINDCLQQFNKIPLESVPRLMAHFDPLKWQATNPMQHPEVYKLNQEQLREWGEIATTIRKKIEKKAENYIIFSRAVAEDEKKPKNRRCIPHSTP